MLDQGIEQQGAATSIWEEEAQAFQVTNSIHKHLRV